MYVKSLLFFSGKLFQYRRQLVIGILLSFTLALSSIALLSLSGWFIASAAFAGLLATTAAQFNYFIPAASIRALALLRILSRYFDRVVNHDYTFKILANLRVWFYQQLIPLAPAHLLKSRSGQLLNRIVNDIDMLDQLYLNTLSPLFISITITILMTIFIAHFSITLSYSLFLMIVFSLIFIGTITIVSGRNIGHNIQESTALLRTAFLDFLQGFIDFLLLIKPENRLTCIITTSHQLAHAQKKLAILKGFIIASMQLFSGMTVFIFLAVGIQCVTLHHFSGAILTMMILLVMATFEQLSVLPLAFLSLGKTSEAADRLNDITQQKPTIVFIEKSPSLKNHSIVIRDISFKYPNATNTILTHFNLSIPCNTKLGITGSSGFGKTTLAYLLARIWDPQRGEITIGGCNIKNLSENELRKSISLVTQQVHIFSANVRDNLTLERGDISDDQCLDVLAKMELLEAIHALPDGLNTWMGEFGSHFSGGQIRRIAIARALLAHTSILILDEPSTGLEKTLMQRIWKNCETDFKYKTVITITHDQQLLSMMDTVLALPVSL